MSVSNCVFASAKQELRSLCERGAGAAGPGMKSRVRAVLGMGNGLGSGGWVRLFAVGLV